MKKYFCVVTYFKTKIMWKDEFYRKAMAAFTNIWLKREGKNKKLKKETKNFFYDNLTFMKSL